LRGYPGFIRRHALTTLKAVASNSQHRLAIKSCHPSASLVEHPPSLQHDPNRPEDVLKVDADEDGVGGDDTADCLRYLVATKSRAVTQRKLRGL